MKLFAYFADVPDLNRFDELKLITLWRQYWTRAGWQPFVLNEWYAQKHPLYGKLDEFVSKLPSSNPKAYERACYIRWLALAQAGGGWMADYDVFPRITKDGDWVAPMFSGPDPMPGCWHDITGKDMNDILVLQTPCCPAVVYCSPENAVRFCEQVIAETRSGLGLRPQGDRQHYSDQYALEDLAMRGKLVKPRDVVKIWSDKGWETAPLIHFANAVMGPKNLLPRWNHIPEMLK